MLFLQIEERNKLRKGVAASVVVCDVYAVSLVASLTCLKSQVSRPLPKDIEGDIRR